MAPRIIYHRGRHGSLADGRVVKENSLDAFREAVRERAEMVEFDVWTGLKVVHDPDTGEEAPHVSDVLDILCGRTSVNVELKSPGAAGDVLRLIGRGLSSGVWKPSEVVLSSFHHETVLRCKKTLPAVRVGAIMDGVPLPGYIEGLRAAGIDNLHIHWSNIYMDAENGGVLRALAQRLGMKVWVWTVNAPEVYQVVAEYGAEAVFTDTPDALRR